MKEQDVRVRSCLQQRLVQGTLGRREPDVLMQPLRQRIPRRQRREVIRRARHRLDLVDVDGLEERLARWEVPVKRPDSDPGPLGHVLERR